mgnify:CR=1 FL=1
MDRKTLFLSLILSVPVGNAAYAGYDANSGTGSWIDIRSDESESDKLLGLSCAGLGQIDVHLGGEFGIGKGGHEAVSATLSTGKTSATLKGLSIETADAEMTGGIELLTSLAPDDKAFGILASGKEISLKHGGTTEKFMLGKSATDALTAFLKACS